MADKSVLISGIGIAGPTLAHWLSRYGFRPTLVERAPRLRSGGYIIDFWGLGYDVAERMGLLSELEREDHDVADIRFDDDCGRRVGGFGIDIFRKLVGGRYVSLRRTDLARLIYRTIEHQCECIFGDGIAGIEQGRTNVHVQFEQAPARQFDLVIGADGLYSVVRRLVFGSQDRFEKYLGYMVAAFEIEGYRPRDERTYVSYAVPGKQVSRIAMRDDRTMFLFVFAAAQSQWLDPHNRRDQKAILRKEFDGTGWECARILTALDRSEDIYFDRVSQIRMDTWSRGRVALVGDAAFCPSLLSGQGSALAMTAAYVLAGELAKAECWPEKAFRQYEEVLRSFIVCKQRAAEKFAGSFAPKTWFGLFMRNQITKAFRIPLITSFVIGRDLLLDSLELPAYSVPRAPPRPTTLE
jgi:2-polyprenyl-6-methoxyphenol hydroxylase-like FAD-dependent oxidoreductase